HHLSFFISSRRRHTRFSRDWSSDVCSSDLGHGHHHHHHHTEGQKNLLMAFGLNFFFAIVEVIGGYLTNSMAVMSDALHDFGDSKIGRASCREKVEITLDHCEVGYGRGEKRD